MANWKQQREERERLEAEAKRQQELEKKAKLQQIVKEADMSGIQAHVSLEKLIT